MLLLVKTTGEYNGVQYDYPGPAHLSIGQEAAAVGRLIILIRTTSYSDPIEAMER